MLADLLSLLRFSDSMQIHFADKIMDRQAHKMLSLQTHGR